MVAKLDDATRDRSDYPHEDLRDLIGRIEAIGELKRIDGVDWDLELGAILEMIYHAEPDNPPALLFENIKDYGKGCRIASGPTIAG